jgi:hypothetical protein
MKIEAYVSRLRAEMARLEAQRASIVQRGCRMWSRWGMTPFVETTGMWLAELDRRIAELAGLTKTIERRRQI